MQSIIKKLHSNNNVVDNRSAVHARHGIGTGKAITVCGIKDGKWTNTKRSVSCKACIGKMAVKVTEGVECYRALLFKTLFQGARFAQIYANEIEETLDKKYPLYIFVMPDQRAFLHKGNATTPEEAMEQLGSITDEREVLAIIETSDYRGFKLLEVKEAFCPACATTGDAAGDCCCAK